MDLVSESIAKLKEFEGCVPWMYLDTLGNVTVWVGLLVPNAVQACQLPFHWQGGPQEAGSDAIVAEWNRVKAMGWGKLPGYYRCSSSLVLLDADGDALLRKRWMQDDADLAVIYTDYEGLPDAAKMALHDMIFNVGEGDLVHDYPHFRAAIDAGDFATAAAQCHRRGISDERNEWTAQQFQLAVALTG